MIREVQLVHTLESDTLLATLRAPQPVGYGVSSWGTAFRLLYVYATNPGKMGQGKIKTKAGWAWTCLRCKRELVADREQRPAFCPYCKSKMLEGHESSVFYLAERTGQDYAGGLDLVEFVKDFTKWSAWVTPDPRAFRVMECWAQGLGTREAAAYARSSQRYACLSINALSEAYQTRDVLHMVRTV